MKQIIRMHKNTDKIHARIDEIDHEFHISYTHSDVRIWSYNMSRIFRIWTVFLVALIYIDFDH